MGILSKIFSNTRKPEGFFGRMMVNGMNGGSHARMAEWGLSFVDIANNWDILDVGCGGGANVARLLKRSPKGTVTGIDYSPVSVKKSTEVNAAEIAAGRCKVVEGSAAQLPFGENTFDLVTAFEAVYFWPEIEKCFAGVRRTLKDGGREMGKTHRRHAHIHARRAKEAPCCRWIQQHHRPPRRPAPLACRNDD